MADDPGDRNERDRYLRCLKERFKLIVDDAINGHHDVVPRLTVLQQSVRRIRGIRISREAAQFLLVEIDNLFREIRTTNNAECPGPSGYRATRESLPRHLGAPSYNITQEQLVFLIDCGFSAVQMATILGVSPSTVKRRLRLFGMKLSDLYSTISDADLDRAVVEITRGNDQLGPNSVRSRLFSNGIKVQRYRIRESLFRVDPYACAQRALPNRLQRRTYSVAGPNSLWHLDGNHKLIRWRVVIHGGIDGFSRLLVFLRASNNNRSETVMECFTKAINKYGVPSRTRCDFGGENNDVCLFMETMQGQGRGSAIRGKSTHNQRIERLWVDMWCGVTNLYHDLFSFMEEEGLLDPDDENHMWALHYVFMPRINRDLALFRHQWNNHSLRTENHSTPNQLYVRHTLALQSTSHSHHRHHHHHHHQYDHNHQQQQQQHQHIQQPQRQEEEEEEEEEDHQQQQQQQQPGRGAVLWRDAINIPETVNNLSALQLQQLMEIVEPLDDTDDRLGFGLFRRTIEFLETRN